MNILECLYGNPSERAAKLNEHFRKVAEIQEQSLSSHPMAAPLKPRTSTLRVRTIRWKFMLSDLDMFHLHRTLRDVGAIQTLSTHIGEMSILQSRPSIVRTITHVTWPEARK